MFDRDYALASIRAYIKFTVCVEICGLWDVTLNRNDRLCTLMSNSFNLSVLLGWRRFLPTKLSSMACIYGAV